MTVRDWLIAEYELEAAELRAKAKAFKTTSIERDRLLRDAYARQKFANALRKGARALELRTLAPAPMQSRI